MITRAVYEYFNFYLYFQRVCNWIDLPADGVDLGERRVARTMTCLLIGIHQGAGR